MVATKKKPVAQRNSSALLHEAGDKPKARKNHSTRKTKRPLGSAESDNAKLTKAENALAVQAASGTETFDEIVVISNPGTVVAQGFRVLQIWFETYRTTAVEAIGGVLHLTQEVIFGTNIISSYSTEAQARQECYGLAEELEHKFVGFMPNVGSDIAIVFPLHDLESSFVQMEQSGLFTLNIMWSLTWQIAKGAKS